MGFVPFTSAVDFLPKGHLFMGAGGEGGEGEGALNKALLRA